MIIIRGTEKLRKRLTHTPPEITTASEIQSALGDWHATAIFTKPQLVLFVNDATRLPVFVDLAPAKTLIPRFRNVLSKLLHSLRVQPTAIARELAALQTVAVMRTNNKSVLGTMNQIILEFSYYKNDVINDTTDPELRLSWECARMWRKNGTKSKDFIRPSEEACARLHISVEN